MMAETTPMSEEFNLDDHARKTARTAARMTLHLYTQARVCCSNAVRRLDVLRAMVDQANIGFWPHCKLGAKETSAMHGALVHRVKTAKCLLYHWIDLGVRREDALNAMGLMTDILNGLACSASSDVEPDLAVKQLEYRAGYVICNISLLSCRRMSVLEMGSQKALQNEQNHYHVSDSCACRAIASLYWGPHICFRYRCRHGLTRAGQGSGTTCRLEDWRSPSFRLSVTFSTSCPRFSCVLQPRPNSSWHWWKCRCHWSVHYDATAEQLPAVETQFNANLLHLLSLLPSVTTNNLTCKSSPEASNHSRHVFNSAIRKRKPPILTAEPSLQYMFLSS